MIRVALGSIYHYGIYVSDEEVIQFGYPPILRDKDKDNIVVVATDIDTFSCGQMVQVGKLTFHDHLKRFRPEHTVTIARNRIGEGGYNIIHNNCEHFAYECYTGVKYSSQESEARKKWSQTPFVNVYVSEIPEEIDFEVVTPSIRQEEIDNCSSQEVKKEKYWDWKVLAKAIQKDVKTDIGVVNFKKEKDGKWICPEFYFSLSHTKGLVVVAISNFEVGVDVEYLDRFSENDPHLEGLKNKIACKNETITDSKNLLMHWVMKESIYKYNGKGKYIPNKIEIKKHPAGAYVLDEKIIVGVCSTKIDNIRFYSYFNDKSRLFDKKVEKIS